MTLPVFIATICGLLTGIVTALVWNALLSRRGESTFRPALEAFVKQLASGVDGAQLFRQYVDLVKQLGGYVGQNLLVLVLAFLPVTVFVIVAGPPARRFWNAGADHIAVYSSEPVTVSLGAETFRVDPPMSEIPVPNGPDVSLDLTFADASVHIDSAARNWACSASAFPRLLLELLDFEQEAVSQGPALAIVRPRRRDSNPLWPWMNDLEFAFMASLTTASTALMVAAGLRAGKT
ncbi:MAG: hypothetical protein ACT4QC_07255 [Planctomycetaceae bacterium]